MASVRKREWVTPSGEKKTAWVVTYTDFEGKRRLKTYPLKKVADAERLRIEVEIEKGVHLTPTQSKRVREVCDLFLKLIETRMQGGDVGFGYYRQCKSVIDNHILRAFDSTVISELTLPVVEDWYHGLVKRLHPSTAKSYLAILGLIEDYAFKRGYTRQRVVPMVSKTVGKAAKRVIRTFSFEQAKHLLATAEERRPKGGFRSHQLMRLAVQLAALCGLRFGEIMGLTVGAIDFEGRIIRVRNNLTAEDLLKGPKTLSGNRDVPMPDVVAENLKLWMAKFMVKEARGLVFRNKHGLPITSFDFHSHHWRPLLRRAGLERKEDPFHFHALRHFASSHMIESGLSMPDVASLLGHSKFDMTLQVYAHPIMGGNHRHQAFDAMASALK